MAQLTLYMEWVLAFFAMPKYGLSSVFLVSFVSATLLPLGSEPAVFGLIKLNPALFWPTILVATLGNTLGGGVSWWMGRGTQRLAERSSHKGVHLTALNWLEKLGPKACLLAWVPVVGDPLCFVAGWLALPFWPSLIYMAIGKFLRYFLVTSALLWALPFPLPPFLMG
jgi:membrane protein YqaA with SNARE-associated domain